MLERLKIIAKIADALANRGFVVVIQVLKDGAPDGHVLGAVSREAGAEAQRVGNVFEGKFSVMALGKSGEIGDARV